MICILCMFSAIKTDMICLPYRFFDDVITGQDDVISKIPPV